MCMIIDATKDEWDACVDYLPYALQDYVIRVQTIKSEEHTRLFNEYKKIHHAESRMFFKGCHSYDWIEETGMLKVELSNEGGKFTNGQGIYLADDPALSFQYAYIKHGDSMNEYNILVVETACKWMQIIKGDGYIHKIVHAEDALQRGYGGVICMDDGKNDQAPNEYICFDNNAMNLRYMLTIEMPPFNL